jgi:DNA invertase Pin-like site-specific DNA recombinase
MKRTRAAVAAYTRVSTRAQGFGLQRADINRMARAHGDTITIWVQEKKGGDKARPELEQLCELARRGHVRRIYAWSLDRIARSGIRPTLQLIQDLRSWGCELVTCRERFDFNGPAGEMLVAAFSYCAQFELARLRERISAARRHKAERGEHWGRPRAATPATIRTIRELRREGDVSIRDIARHVGVTRSTVADVLSEKGAYLRPSKASKKTRVRRLSE